MVIVSENGSLRSLRITYVDAIGHDVDAKQGVPLTLTDFGGEFGVRELDHLRICV